MKKSRQIFLLVILLSTITSLTAYADSSVNISNNSTGSNSHVEIHSTTNTSDVSNSTGHTSVRIETNGNVKTYDSDNPGSVHLESDDGTSKVDINNGNSADTSQENYQTPSVTSTQKQEITETQKKIEAAQEKVKEKLAVGQQKQKSFITRIEDFFHQLLLSFGFK
jgi:hypothetical protein